MKSLFIYKDLKFVFDTAGKRDSSTDEIEIQGMNLGTELMNEMDAIILVVDPKQMNQNILKQIVLKIECNCMIAFTHADIVVFEKFQTSCSR